MPDNVTSMAYNARNGAPWHRKGTAVDGLMTAAECMRKAGLDWTVAKMPVRVDEVGGLSIPGYAVTVRNDLPAADPNRILGVVGDMYEPLQNYAAFGFFDSVIGKETVRYETAGAIAYGRKVWLLASLSKPLVPAPGDEVKPYFLLANGHDGSLMLHIKFTPVRVVCENTLVMALVEKDRRRVAIRHDKHLRHRLRDATELFKTINATTERASVLWKRMVGHHLVAADVDRYFGAVFGGDSSEAHDAMAETEVSPEPTIQGQARPRGLKAKAFEDFESKRTKELKIQGTLWAAYNAVVWAVDFGRDSRRDRVEDLCLGEGARLKERALAKAEELIRV